MPDDQVQELLAEIARLRESLQAIVDTPRRDGILACHRIAAAALRGLAAAVVQREASLGDPVYFARVMRHLRKRWQNKCAYCEGTDGPFQPDHVLPVSRGGDDKIGNLVLSCVECNRRKGTQTATEFGYPLVAIVAAGTVLSD